jgi:hypothetical protein
MIEPVKVWYMTEEERLEYIKKYPINPTKKERVITFSNDKPDYKWRGKKAADAKKRSSLND